MTHAPSHMPAVVERQPTALAITEFKEVGESGESDDRLFSTESRTRKMYDERTTTQQVPLVVVSVEASHVPDCYYSCDMCFWVACDLWCVCWLPKL